MRMARSYAGLSARGLSALAGLAPSHVNLIETRVENVGAQTVASLARVLGVTTDWLITGKGEPPTEESVRAAVKRAKRSRAA